jgi:hypothetical protein
VRVDHISPARFALEPDTAKMLGWKKSKESTRFALTVIFAFITSVRRDVCKRVQAVFYSVDKTTS